MKKSSVIALALVVLNITAPDAALGLSCAAPTLNESVIAGAAVIFEGVAGQERALDFRDHAAVRAAGLAQLGGGTGDLKVFGFTVTKGWKGAADGQSLRILRNTYWGDAFSPGDSYLVVGERVTEGLYLSPLCGNTMPITFAVESGQLTTLERLMGDGVQN